MDHDVTNTISKIPTNNFSFSLRELLGKINRYHIIALISFILVVSAIIRALTPPLPSKELLVTNTLQTNTQINIEFSPDISISIPEELSIYKSDGTTQTTATFANNLAQKLQFSLLPDNINTWVDEDFQRSITVEEVNNDIRYQLFVTPDEITTLTKSVSDNQAKEIVNEFMTKQIGISSNQTYTIVPILITEEDFIVSETETNAYLVEAFPEIDSIPLFLGSKRSKAVQAVVLSDGRILRATFYPANVVFTKERAFKTLSLTQVENNMKNGTLTYLLAVSNGDNYVNPENLTFITFSATQLEYRKNESNGFILPYLRFSGQGTDENGNTFDVEAISPAIPIQQ